MLFENLASTLFKAHQCLKGQGEKNGVWYNVYLKNYNFKELQYSTTNSFTDTFKKRFLKGPWGNFCSSGSPAGPKCLHTACCPQRAPGFHSVPVIVFVCFLTWVALVVIWFGCFYPSERGTPPTALQRGREASTAHQETRNKRHLRTQVWEDKQRNHIKESK